jgi:hypothetical protein
MLRIHQSENGPSEDINGMATKSLEKKTKIRLG